MKTKIVLIVLYFLSGCSSKETHENKIVNTETIRSSENCYVWKLNDIIDTISIESNSESSAFDVLNKVYKGQFLTEDKQSELVINANIRRLTIENELNQSFFAFEHSKFGLIYMKRFFGVKEQFRLIKCSNENNTKIDSLVLICKEFQSNFHSIIDTLK